MTDTALLRQWRNAEEVEIELNKSVLYQQNAVRKLALNIARHTNPVYSETLYKTIENPDVIILTGSASLGKTMMSRLCSTLRYKSPEAAAARYLELQLSMISSNCGSTVAVQIYDFLARQTEADSLVIFLDEVGSKEKINTNQQFWRYLYQFFNTGRLQLNGKRSAVVGVPGRLTLILACNVGMALLSKPGMRQHNQGNTRTWRQAEKLIKEELSSVLFKDGEAHIISRIIKPATIIYFFDYEAPMKQMLIEKLLLEWVSNAVKARIRFDTNLAANLAAIWSKEGYDLRSFLGVYKKLFIDVVAQQLTLKHESMVFSMDRSNVSVTL